MFEIAINLFRSLVPGGCKCQNCFSAVSNIGTVGGNICRTFRTCVKSYSMFLSTFRFSINRSRPVWFTQRLFVLKYKIQTYMSPGGLKGCPHPKIFLKGYPHIPKIGIFGAFFDQLSRFSRHCPIT